MDLGRTRGKPRVNDRRGLSAGIVHVLKSGGRWTSSSLNSLACTGYVERVSSQFLSLRQSFLEQLSPRGFERAQTGNNGRHSREDLRTSLTPSGSEILSLGPFVSKPSDFAFSVRRFASG
jgi:hypothetical protein